MRLDTLHIAPQELPFLNVLDGVNLRIGYFALRLRVGPKGIKGLCTCTQPSFPTLTPDSFVIIKLYV